MPVDPDRLKKIREKIQAYGIPVSKPEKSPSEKINQRHSDLSAIKAADIACYIDHTNLKPQVTEKDIVNLCEEAKKFQFFGVCINPVHVELAKGELKNTNVKIITVIDFPLGANPAEIKIEQANRMIAIGADELDMVIPIGFLKANEYKKAFEHITGVVQAAGANPVKVILEMCLLNEEEKIAGALLSKFAGATFVKTSTGFSTGGATVEDVQLLRETVGDAMGIKAAGGIKTFEMVRDLIDAGATRIGCSSSVDIMKEIKA